jgi:hypothetical protein
VLVAREPRGEKPAEVIAKRKTDLPGLCGADLSKDQQAKLHDTMRRAGASTSTIQPPESGLPSTNAANACGGPAAADDICVGIATCAQQGASIPSMRASSAASCRR